MCFSSLFRRFLYTFWILLTRRCRRTLYTDGHGVVGSKTGARGEKGNDTSGNVDGGVGGGGGGTNVAIHTGCALSIQCTVYERWTLVFTYVTCPSNVAYWSWKTVLFVRKFTANRPESLVRSITGVLPHLSAFRIALWKDLRTKRWTCWTVTRRWPARISCKCSGTYSPRCRRRAIWKWWVPRSSEGIARLGTSEIRSPYPRKFVIIR